MLGDRRVGATAVVSRSPGSEEAEQPWARQRPATPSRVPTVSGLRPLTSILLLVGVVAATAAPEELLSRARAHEVPARVVGETGGERLRIGPEGGAPWIDAGVGRLRAVWERALPRRLEEA